MKRRVTIEYLKRRAIPNFNVNFKLHKFATTNSNFKKLDYFRHAASYKVHVDQFSTKSGKYRSVKMVHTNIGLFTNNCKLHKFATTNSNIENNIVLIIFGTCTQICLHIIASCINLKLPIVILKIILALSLLVFLMMRPCFTRSHFQTAVILSQPATKIFKSIRILTLSRI